MRIRLIQADLSGATQPALMLIAAITLEHFCAYNTIIGPVKPQCFTQTLLPISRPRATNIQIFTRACENFETCPQVKVTQQPDLLGF